ncbi:hypothetical protein C7445_1114 [Alicyclobacillus sacchari]|uniref:Uncharacterized protein n=1 Tax=Alicyclobacillus sacchari TaxID=392010 RepID=A0A4R8LIT9_9BACL|nr:hypothetical protein C7445_1114 [Alicyclobacillus sacchari]
MVCQRPNYGSHRHQAERMATSSLHNFTLDLALAESFQFLGTWRTVSVLL